MADVMRQAPKAIKHVCLGVFITLVLGACAGPASTPSGAPISAAKGAIDPEESDVEFAEEVTLPALVPANLEDGQSLRIVATTNIVADVVAQVGGDAVDLVALIPPGADPHSFVAKPKDLTALADAHIVFISGLHLEESLEPFLGGLQGRVPVVSVNAGVDLLVLGADGETHGGRQEETGANHEEGAKDAQAHQETDPHTWFSVHAVEQWVKNIEHSLSEVDPDNAEAYSANASGYLQILETLDDELDTAVASISPAQRKLVTDHESLGYFANEHNFELIGTVIPSLSTLASPSASELARLQKQIGDEEIRAIFVGTTVNPGLAAQIAADTGVQVVPIYTGSLSEGDGPAPTYLDFMRYNVTAIVDALRE